MCCPTLLFSAWLWESSALQCQPSQTGITPNCFTPSSHRRKDIGSTISQHWLALSWWAPSTCFQFWHLSLPVWLAWQSRWWSGHWLLGPQWFTGSHPNHHDTRSKLSLRLQLASGGNVATESPVQGLEPPTAWPQSEVSLSGLSLQSIDSVCMYPTP